MGPLGVEKTCCGITKKGNTCKLAVKKETLKEGRHKLNNLARSPFDLSTLESQLNEIWWFNAAVRNQTQAQISPHRDSSLSAAEQVSDSQEVLRGAIELDVLSTLMWDVEEISSPELFTSTRIGSSQSPGREGAKCPVCFEEESNNPIILQCDMCKGVVHLECMEGWLAHRLLGNNTSCPIHRCNGSFITLYPSSLAGNAISESNIDEYLEDTGIVVEGSGALTAPSQRRSPSPARWLNCSPVSDASTSSPFCRSARLRRVPDRFLP
ncbi:unnamed protein product [Penicillium salamii]|nr:unnamed protein product [Penicillium salamii]CAG8254992.1 unnamed protein product [Penicillium salamii]